MTIAISVIAVGTELLTGELCDTNTSDIARALAQQGYTLRDTLVVADVEADIAEALRSRARHRDAVIVTGGLGPTEDDLTARSAARAFGKHLVLNEDALAQIRDFFRRRGRTMHGTNEKQALLPHKVTILPNPTGSAPGFTLRHEETVFYFLPGVPSEMAVMLAESVLPDLQRRTGPLPPRQERILKIFGLPEAKVAEQLRGTTLPEAVELAYGLDFPIVLVKLRCTGEEAEEHLDRAELQVRKALGEHLVAIGEGSLPGTVVQLLLSQGLHLALAESCTGGLIAKQVTDTPGASDVFDRGAVTYSNESKQRWLGVGEIILNRHGAVSAECARAMAIGIRRIAASDLGLAVTGIAGPGGGTEDKPVGTVYIALATEKKVEVKRFRFNGDRQRIRILTSASALDWLRRHLIEELSG